MMEKVRFLIKMFAFLIGLFLGAQFASTVPLLVTTVKIGMFFVLCIVLALLSLVIGRR